MRAAMRSTRPLCCVSVRVLRAYIYNALFTTAKPPKIRLSFSLSLSPLFRWLRVPSVVSLYLRCPYRLFSHLFLSWCHGFFYTSVAVDRHSIVPLRFTPGVTVPCSFCSFYRGLSSHLRVLALTSRTSLLFL